MGRTLVFHPTELAQWHALVNDAGKTRNLFFAESIESYLVFLLMRFASKPEVMDSIVGLEFLESHQAAREHQFDQLRDLGDKCLLFAGLFPGQADRRRVSVDYFVHLGQNAYGVLSATESSRSADLFAELSLEFTGLSQLLQAIRELEQAEENSARLGLASFV